VAKVPVRKIQIAGGQTFTDTVVWCEGPYVFKTISALTLGWPTTISATAHGVPAGVTIPIWIQNARGPSINTTEETPHFAQRVDANTLVLVGVNTGGQTAYVANSATLAYMPPKDITNYTARCQFRRSVVSGTILIDAVSTGLTPQITITGAVGQISLTLTPAEGRLLLDNNTLSTGIAQIELVSPDSRVYRPWDYAWTATPEGTREA
jgi:hypothetical protein